MNGLQQVRAFRSSTEQCSRAQAHLELILLGYTKGNSLSQFGGEVESEVSVPTVDTLITEQHGAPPFIHEEEA